MKDIVEVVHRYLRDSDTSWTVAVFGAIAEYHTVPGEPQEVRLSADGGTIIGSGGALRVALSGPVRLAPYEFLTKRRDFWLHGVNLCLPDDVADIGCGRPGLAELGPDEEAIRQDDRPATLFDLGLGRPTLQAMIRTADPALIKALRGQVGRNLLGAEGAETYRLILAGQPHRVFQSRLGRVEVYNPIPAPDGRTAPGPHTHILPDLLASGRTHSANVPVPPGHVPVLHFCPPNPILQREGEAAPTLDRGRMAAFDALLDRFGEAELEAAKRLARDGVRAGSPPPDTIGLSRRERTAIRVALRKLAACSPGDAAVARWQAAFETQPAIPPVA
ncbi:MAG: hypothetical protein RLW87_04535 [Alphaproteobacteria bacterium]